MSPVINMDAPVRKKSGKLSKAVHSLPLLHFNRDVENIKKSKTANSSPKSLSSSENTPKSFKFTSTEKTLGRTTMTFSYDSMNTTSYKIFSFKLLDDGMIYCKGLFKQSLFTFSYELVSKQYEGRAVLFENGVHTIITGDWNDNDLVLRVYSRNWDRKEEAFSKKYPVYVTCRTSGFELSKFIDDHYYIIMMWFA